MAVVGKLELYTNRICPFAHRAAFAAGLLGLKPEIKYTPTSGEVKQAKLVGVECLPNDCFKSMSPDDINTLKENYIKSINATGEVPSLKTEKGDIFVESEICAEFLDHMSTQASLVPADPVLAAKVRLAMKFFNDVVMACYGLLLNQDPAADAEKAAAIQTKLERFAGVLDTKTAFCVSDQPTLADVHCGPFLWRFNILLPHYRGYDLFKGVPVKVKELLAKIEALPELHVLTPISPEELKSAYEAYAHGRKMADEPKLGAVWAGRGKSEFGK